MDSKHLSVPVPKNTNPTFYRPDIVDDVLYVISPVFNPIRFRSRWKLYKQYEEYMLAFKKVVLVTVECTFGERSEVLTKIEGENHIVIHVHTKTEAWLKENLINIAISRLPLNWKYVAWIDADIQFARPDWVGETLQQLQHYKGVQMFSESADLSPNYEIIKTHKSFMWCYQIQGDELPPLKNGCYYTHKGPKSKVYWHPGFAWAARREAIDALGGLIDWGILGGGDMYMAYVLIGKLKDRALPQSLGEQGVKMLLEWEHRAETHIKRNVGFVAGLILHYWHGKKADRKYADRGQVLSKALFNPDKDLKRDWQGLWQLSGENPKLRDGMMGYFRQRNEDSIDL